MEVNTLYSSSLETRTHSRSGKTLTCYDALEAGAYVTTPAVFETLRSLLRESIYCTLADAMQVSPRGMDAQAGRREEGARRAAPSRRRAGFPRGGARSRSRRRWTTVRYREGTATEAARSRGGYRRTWTRTRKDETRTNSGDDVERRRCLLRGNKLSIYLMERARAPDASTRLSASSTSRTRTG